MIVWARPDLKGIVSQETFHFVATAKEFIASGLGLEVMTGDAACSGNLNRFGHAIDGTGLAALNIHFEKIDSRNVLVGDYLIQCLAANRNPFPTGTQNHVS